MMLKIIKKNILYRPFRNGALIFCFALIAASLFSGNYILDGATESVSSGISRLGADVIVVPKDYTGESEAVILRGEPSTFFFETDVLPIIEGIKGVSRVAPQIYISTVNGTFSTKPVQIIGFDPDRDFTITPWLDKNNHVALKKDEVLVGSQIISDIGTKLRFYGHEFTITGKLQPTGTGVDTSVFVRTEDAYTMAEESKERSSFPLHLPDIKYSAILVKVDNASQADEISYQIVNSIWGVKVITPEVLISTVSNQLNSLTRLLYLTAIVATILSLPLISLISVIAVNERVREIGVLRALGATKGLIFRLTFGETLVISAFGGTIGVVLSLIFLITLQDYIGTITRLPLTAPDIWTMILLGCSSIAMTTIIGGIASLYPAYRSAVMDPYSAIRSGEL